MSTTTTPSISPNIPVQAIVTATTPGDVIRAMTDNPELRGAVLSAFQGLLSGDKSMLQSKTFWAAILMPVLTGLVSYFGLNLDAQTIGVVVVLMSAAAANMIAMRLVTKTPVTGIISAKSAT